jgi:hypothetical protein
MGALGVGSESICPYARVPIAEVDKGRSASVYAKRVTGVRARSHTTADPVRRATPSLSPTIDG